MKYSGKEYDINGNLILELEKGEGNEFYKYEKIKFEGQYFNGKRLNGKGYHYRSGEVIFEINQAKGNIEEIRS